MRPLAPSCSNSRASSTLSPSGSKLCTCCDCITKREAAGWLSRSCNQAARSSDTLTASGGTSVRHADSRPPDLLRHADRQQHVRHADRQQQTSDTLDRIRAPAGYRRILEYSQCCCSGPPPCAGLDSARSAPTSPAHDVCAAGRAGRRFGALLRRTKCWSKPL